jgi:DNA-binding IclR family transcriptional regulator
MPLAEPAESRYSIAVVGQALDLLAELARRGDVSTADAVDLLGVSRSTAYRLLVTLEGRRFVERDRLTKQWSLGPAFLSISRDGLGTALRVAALPSMRRLLQEEEETVNLADFAHGTLTYVEILESPRPFRMTAAAGLQAPLHSTAIGKALLAHLSEAERDALLPNAALEPVTDRTITTRAALDAELAEALRRGWTLERGENEVGLACIGAAILGPAGEPMAGISMSIPMARLDDARTERIGARIFAEASAIGAAIAEASELSRSTRRRRPSEDGR